jgi:hypothetical protein
MTPLEWSSPLGTLLAFGLLNGVIWAVFVVLWRRRERRWQREDQVQQQRWALEQQIREEGLSADWRQWHQEARQRQAAIRQEARRRLGLPEEEDPRC